MATLKINIEYDEATAAEFIAKHNAVIEAANAALPEDGTPQELWTFETYAADRAGKMVTSWLGEVKITKFREGEKVFLAADSAKQEAILAAINDAKGGGLGEVGGVVVKP